MKHLMTSFTVFLLFLASITSLSAQNKDSVQGDFEALTDLYLETQGQHLEVLSSQDDLPSFENASYPYMYMIDGEVWSFINEHDEWINKGGPWLDKTGWEDMTPETMGNAVGVETDSNGRVVRLDLQKVTHLGKNGRGQTIWNGNNVAGPLPSSVGNLKKIKVLNIKQNSFTGEIPKELGLLRNLERLSLGGQRGELDIESGQWYEPNHRGVSLPSSFGLPGKGFEEGNAFYGPIPGELGDLLELELLEIRRQFLTGTLPLELGNLKNLKGLFLNGSKAASHEKLGGEIPEEYQHMESIRFFQLAKYGTMYGGRGNFNGEFPEVINEAWTNLVHIILTGNKFTGSIPEFPNSRAKRVAKFNGNDFTGEFPSRYFNGDNANLSILDITYNNLSGEFPETIPDATYPGYNGQYEIMAAHRYNHNNFTGTVPKWIQNPGNIQQLQLQSNQFEGSFPEYALQSPRLRLFWIQDNNFFGELPNVEWSSNRVRGIVLSDNNFTGKIPEKWESIYTSAINEDGEFVGRLWRFLIENNDLQGEIPGWLSNFPDLELMRIHGNRFTFKDILPTYEAISDVVRSNGREYQYAPQRPFGFEQNRTMPEGNTVVFDLSEYDYEGNKYQWMKNGAPIEGADGPVLTIRNVNRDDEAVYHLEVRNDALPDLGNHSSQPISFTIGEDDGLNGSGSSSGDNDDSDGDGNTSSFVFPAAPKQHSPGDELENVSVSPQLSWSSVEGADSYILHMSRNSPHGMVLDVVVEDTTYTHPEILGDGSLHHWRVWAVKDGEQGEASEIFQFRTESIDLPEMADLIGPNHSENNVSLTPTLEWEPVNVDSYKVRIIKRDSSEMLYTVETELPYYEISVPLNEETAYIWQVKSLKDGINGAWGPRWEFNTGEYNYFTEPPVLVSPDKGTQYTSLTPTFEWQHIDTDHYVISVSRETPSNAKVLSGAVEESVVIYSEVTESFYTSDVALDPETTYFWRVKAVKDGQEGEWSETWEFVTPGKLTTLQPDGGDKPAKTALNRNYPNPFNPTTQIEFTVAESGPVSLKVYNVTGQLVANLVEGMIQAGRHTATFDASNLASGVYIYRLVAGTYQSTERMTLVK